MNTNEIKVGACVTYRYEPQHVTNPRKMVEGAGFVMERGPAGTDWLQVAAMPWEQDEENWILLFLNEIIAVHKGDASL